MALTASLALDIRAFEAGLEKATDKLDVFAQKTVKNTSRDLSRLLEDFTGQKVVAEAARMAEAVERIGGASKLTEKEQARVNATISDAIAKYKALGQDAPQSLRTLEQETRKVENASTSWSSKLDSVVTGAVAGLSATVTNFAINALGSAVRNLGDFLARGSDVAAMRNSFTALAGGVEEAGGRMDVLRAGTRGLVTEFDLMKASNKALLLDLNVNAAKMGELAKTATILGKAMGQDATKSLDDLITALGRSSPMILDNLGLSVKVGEANEAYARALGKTSEALTDAEKKQAFMNAALDAAAEKTRELGGLKLTAADRAKQLATSFVNVSDASASWLVNIGFVNRGLEDLTTNIGTLEALFRGGPKAALDAYRQATGDFVPEMATLGQSMGFVKPPADALSLSMSELEFIERKLTASAKELITQHERAAKSISFIDGELDPLTRLMIDGTIPAMADFATDTGIAERAMAELSVEVARARGELIQIMPPLQNTFKASNLVPFKAAVKDSGAETRSFFQKWKDGMSEAGMGASGLSSLFAQAFTGGGGALGAVKAFATQGLSTLLGMIPGVGQWAQAFAGPIVAMLSKLASKFKALFGGPSASELEGRSLVADFESELADSLTAAQRAEAGTDAWKQTVIALRDAYLAQGRSAEEAEADARKLWESSKDGAEASARVIAEIKKKLDGLQDKEIDVTVNYRENGERPDGGGAASTTPPVSGGVVAGARVNALPSVASAGGTITVPVYLDGFQIAMATAPHRLAANRRWGV